jgi:chemotaxis protein CheD
MKKPANFLEIYLTTGEMHFGDFETRVRTLVGHDGGGVFTLWHPRRHIGCISHFREVRREPPSPQLDPAYADEALALSLLDMSRAATRPKEYVAKVFVSEGPQSERVLDDIQHLLDLYGIKTRVQVEVSGNLVFDIWNGEVWLQKKAPTLVQGGKNPNEIIEVYLHPGEWHFGDEDTRIKTLLGSCVSFTLWHPVRRIGGMCHYMLPSRDQTTPANQRDGRYADEALAFLVDEIEKENTRPQEYIAKVFGGGTMLDLSGINISERNVETARKLVKRYGFQMEGECLGGVGHRNVVFDIWSGEVWLKKGGNEP